MCSVYTYSLSNILFCEYIKNKHENSSERFDDCITIKIKIDRYLNGGQKIKNII